MTGSPKATAADGSDRSRSAPRTTRTAPLGTTVRGASTTSWPLACSMRRSISFDGATAVDAGAGTGAATAELLRRGARVVAVDLSTGMLRRIKSASARPCGRCRCRQHRRPSATRCVADVAVAAFVLNHLPNPVEGLRELARVTRPGGCVLTSTSRWRERSSVEGGDRRPCRASTDFARRLGISNSRAASTAGQRTAPGRRWHLRSQPPALRDGVPSSSRVRVDMPAADARQLAHGHGAPRRRSFGRSARHRRQANSTAGTRTGVRDMPPLELAMVTLVCRVR